MIKDGLTKGQRYYMRHREELCRKRRERYKNNPEPEIEYSRQWRNNHPYLVYLQNERHRLKRRIFKENDKVD